jgi:hypothetical protein
MRIKADKSADKKFHEFHVLVSSGTNGVLPYGLVWHSGSFSVHDGKTFISTYSLFISTIGLIQSAIFIDGQSNETTHTVKPIDSEEIKFLYNHEYSIYTSSLTPLSLVSK